jgi:putative ABC transport system permease protein
MLKNFFKSALRNFSRDKSHSFINIAGLSVGMAVAIVIGLWIWDELSFDRYNTHYDRLARVMQNMSGNGEINSFGGTPFPLADELRSKYGSDFSQVVIGFPAREHILAFGEKMLAQSGAYFEPGAPEILDLTMLHGTKAALRDPDAIILSASVAKTYFGDTDPVNKTMKVDNEHVVRVTGVYKDLPANSSFAETGYFAAWKQLYDNWGLKDRQTPWRMNAFITLVRLAPNADIKVVSAKIKDVKARKVQGEDALAKPELFLQPFSRWHLYSEFRNGKEAVWAHRRLRAPARLYQLYEPQHGPVRKARPRSRHPQSHRLPAQSVGPPVLQRIAAGDHTGFCLRPSACTNVAAFLQRDRR